MGITFLSTPYSSDTLWLKALDWCPFQRNVIASGGGTADRHIRFWNAATGACLNAIDTKSQVQYRDELKVVSYSFLYNK